MGLCGGGGLLVRSVQDVNPQTIFFFCGWPPGTGQWGGVYWFCVTTCCSISGGGTGEGKSPFPSFSVVLAASCQTIDPAPPPSLYLMTLPRSLPGTSCQLSTLLPLAPSYQGQEPLSVSHWLCGIYMETS